MQVVMQLPVLQRRKVASLTSALFLALALTFASRPAFAGEPPTSPVTVAPAGGQAKGIELIAETVDVAITQDGAGVWADTQVWLRLSNPTTQTVSLEVTLPGPAIPEMSTYISPTLPSGLRVRLEEETLATRPSQAAAQPGLTAQLDFPAGARQSIRLSYRQSLPVRDGLVLYAFPLGPSSQWAGKPESIRVSINFGASISAEQLLAQAPASSRYDGQTVTWLWEGTTVKENLWLAFMSQQWWGQLGTARTAAAAPTAGAPEQLALSGLYQQLSALPRLPFAAKADLNARYYPAAVAALQAAVSSRASSPADLARAHASLAQLYRQQADRLAQSSGTVYLELATAEAQAALGQGANDPALRAMLNDGYLRLADAARARGDDKKASDYLARLSDTLGTQTTASASAGQEQLRAARLQLAGAQIARGDLEGARQTLLDTFGSVSVEVPGATRPLARQTSLQVTTLPGTRSVTLTLTNSAHPSGLAALLTRSAASLRTVRGVEVAAGADWLALRIPYRQPADLMESQARLATALPPAPELALLAAGLKADRVAIESSATTLQSTQRYVESVDLRQASRTWENLATQLGAAAREASAKAKDQAGGQELAVLQQALWKADAAAWADLARSARAEYALAFGSQRSARSWQATPAAARSLVAEATDWRAGRVLALAGGAGLALALVAWLIWRWL